MLQGTLKDFGLPDILQLIGIQRKTGVLTLEHEGNSVSVKFVEGSVVGADTGKHSSEDMLGQVLVRIGKITESQLEEALQVQKKSLQRLGHILVKNRFITEGELVEALRVQSMQTIFRLFRWREGNYVVRMTDDVDYDQEHCTPISSETILMEGARMVDEWPIIERRVRSERTVFERTEAAAALDLAVTAPVDSDIDFDFLFEDAKGSDPKREAAEQVTLTQDEKRILSLIDGSRTVQEVCDRSDLGEFDTYRTLSELVTRDLVREVSAIARHEASGRAQELLQRVACAVAALVLCGVVGVNLWSLGASSSKPWDVAGTQQTTNQLRGYASHARLERIESALQVYYLDKGTYPPSLDLVAAAGFLDPGDLLDPWQRPYGFDLSAGGYQLFGLDRDGQASPTFRRSRRFSSAQQMMIGATATP